MVALGERTTPSGQELLAEFIQYGHQRPFEEIVRRYAGMVFNVCFRITKDKHEAEDAMQAVFLTLAQQAKRGADIKALGPWLQQVAKRLALDIRRSKKRRKTREERHHAEQTVRRESILGDALPSADLDELKTVLHEELQKLPAKYRLPLILHYFGGLNRDEMAAELNCKPSTLGVRIFRGREMLAGRLSGRGIHISGMALATLLGFVVKRAVSDALIASTSHAATAMMAGYDGTGMASAHVIGLTRRATSAVAFGKLKTAGLTLLIAGTSLGAGARALQILPKTDLQRVLSNQLNRLIQPLFGPFSRPMLSQGSATSSQKTVAAGLKSSVNYVPQSLVTMGHGSKPIVQPPAIARPTAAVAQPAEVVASSGTASKSVFADPVTAFKPSAPVASASSSETGAAPAAEFSADASESTSVTSGAGGGGSAGGAGSKVFDPLPPQSALARYSDIVMSNNNLMIGSLAVSGVVQKTASGSTALPTSIVQIPVANGSVTETNTGVLRGWGTIQRTGTLFMNGEAVADGKGIDRTLDLSSFTAIATLALSSTDPTATPAAMSAGSDLTDATTSASNHSPPLASGHSIKSSASTLSTPPIVLGAITPPTNGWYAVNHGRLCMGLQTSSDDSSVLTWGDQPDAQLLTLTNSVRLALKTYKAFSADDLDDAVPTQLALLSADRDDVPNLSQITGAPIGIWQVDSNTGSSGVGTIASADLTICYDSLLANALGATQNSVELWTLYAPTDTWQQVDQSTFALDTVDHLVYGSAQDFSYFAVSATPSPDANVDFVRALQLAAIGQPASSSASTASPPQAVPEPAALPLLAMGLGLLARRRRRAGTTH